MLHRARTIHSRRGAIAVLAALLMTFMIGMVAFAVDLGYLCVVQTQAQATADASAMAGALCLSGSVSQAVPQAQACAALNSANGQAVSLASSACVLGNWSTTAGTFGALSGSATSSANAIRVTVSLTSANGNPVNLFFANIFGMKSAGITANSTATDSDGKRWDVVMSQDISQSYSADLSYATSGHLALLSDFNQKSPSSYVGLVQHTGWGSTWLALQQVGSNYASMFNTINNLADCSNNTTSNYNVYGGTATSSAVTTQTPNCSGSDLSTGIYQAINMFNSSAYASATPVGTSKAIIISSDGESNAAASGRNSSAIYTDDDLNDMAQAAAQTAYNAYGIDVYVVFYYHGSDSGADAALLQSLVQGNGTYTEVTNPAAIPAALESLFQRAGGCGVVQ